MKEIFPGIYKEEKELFTVNLIEGKKVYGEKLIKNSGKEFRQLDPTRSKLGAALQIGLKNNHLKAGSKVLYLGASTGTTVSHISDIVGHDGIIYAIEFAERVFRSLSRLAKDRENIAAILADARKPEEYAWIELCDVIFCDLAQPDEIDIAIRNAHEFLKQSGILMIAIKSQSIDIAKSPQQVYKEAAAKLKQNGFDVMEQIDLEPYQEKHAMIVCRKQLTSKEPDK